MPWACSMRATAAPMRCAPPVIRATLPSRGLSGITVALLVSLVRIDHRISSIVPDSTPYRLPVLAPSRPMKLPDRNGQTAAPDPRALPPPTAEEQAHSARLQQRLRAEIAVRGGSISFARFMELALYAPGLGYYAAGKHKFGAAGDFVTAPELGSLFARCLARPCRSILAQLGGGDILEAGAGSGALAADLLLELEALGRLPERYLILELSDELRDRQAETLRCKAPHLLKYIRWLDTLPGSFRGMVLANELLDAMPVERFRVTENGVQQLHVACEDDRFRSEERRVG